MDISEMKSYIPNTILSNLKTDEDIVEFFNDNVKQILDTDNEKIVKEFTIENIMKDFLMSITGVDNGSFLVKGCMALKIEFGDLDPYRMTQDIDMSMKDKDSWDKFVNAIEAGTFKSKNGFSYSIESKRGYNKEFMSDSIKVLAKNNDQSFRFTIDMNIKEKEVMFAGRVNKDTNGIKLYSVCGMLVDKLNVILNKTVCRRVKDLIDVNLIISRENFELREIITLIKLLRPEIQESYSKEGVFILDSKNHILVRHAYSKYNTPGFNKPDLDIILCNIVDFINPITISLETGTTEDLNWKYKGMRWEDV